MKTRISLVMALLASAGLSIAQTNQAATNLLAPVKYSTDWKPHTEWYQSVLSGKSDAPVLTVGQKEYTLRGPLVETFRPLRAPETSDSLEDKLRRIPIVNLIVPYRMPSPPTTRTKYFRWRGESSRPWSSIEQVGANGIGGADNRIHHRPVGTLISVDW